METSVSPSRLSVGHLKQARQGWVPPEGVQTQPSRAAGRLRSSPAGCGGGAGAAAVPCRHTSVNHGFIDCGVSGRSSSSSTEHLRLPKAPASSQRPRDAFTACSPSAGSSPRHLGWPGKVPGGLGTACSRAAPSLAASTASVLLQGAAALPAKGWSCSPALPKPSAPSEGRAARGAAPHPPPGPVAARISRQDAGKSFPLRRSEDGSASPR